MKKILFFLIISLMTFGNVKEELLKEIAKESIPSGSLVVINKGEEIIYNWGKEKEDINFTQNSYVHSGSISKIFTALAIIKLESKGKLSFEDRVVEYTGSLIKDKRFSEIKISNLLTHTSGLEQKSLETAVDDLKELEEFEKVLKESLNFHISSNKLILYSSPASALLGLVIEKVENKPYEDYMEELFAQYGIKGTYNPNRFKEYNIAIGNDKGGRKYTKDYFNLFKSSGDLLISSYDMYKFLSVSFEDKDIKKMFFTRFSTDRNLPGRTFGFSESYYNNERYLFQDGGAPGYNSKLVIIPEKRIAFFLTYTSDKSSFKNSVSDLILKEIFGSPDDGIELGRMKRVEVIEGQYYSVGNYSKSIEKFSTLMSQDTLKKTEVGFNFGNREFRDTKNSYFVDEKGNRAVFEKIDNNWYLHINKSSYKLARGLEKRDVELGLIIILIISIFGVFIYSLFSYLTRNIAKSAYLMLTTFIYLFLLISFFVYLMSVNFWNLVYKNFNFLNIIKIVNILSFIPLTAYLVSRKDQRYSPRIYKGKVVFVFFVIGYIVFLIRYGII